MILSALALAIAAGISAQDTGQDALESGDDVGRSLDKPIAELILDDLALPKAMDRMAAETGVSISIDPRALDRLPWGAQTRLSRLSLHDTTLREALPDILAPLGMRYEVRDAELRILAGPSLSRLTRRATWDELRLLAELSRTPFTPEAFDLFEIQYRITAKVDAPALLLKQLESVGHGNIASVLEPATGSLCWTWLVEEDHIVIITRQAAIARAMARRMTGRYERRHLGEILFELGREADVHVHLKPGTFKQLLPAAVQHYSLFLTNVSIRQALDYIAADTGLAYRIESDGVHVGPADNINELSLTKAINADPYIAKLSVPLGLEGYSFEFLVRESELPDDVRTKRREAIARFVDQLRREAATSQPAATDSP